MATEVRVDYYEHKCDNEECKSPDSNYIVLNMLDAVLQEPRKVYLPLNSQFLTVIQNGTLATTISEVLKVT